MINNLAQEIYSGEVSYGRFITKVGFITSIVMGIIFISISIYLFTRKQENYEEISGIVLNEPIPNCIMKGIQNYTCNVKVQYTLNLQTKETMFSISKLRNPLVQGNPVRLYYLPSDPDNTIVSNKPFNKYQRIILAIIFFLIAVILILGSWMSYYMSKKNDIVAAGYGISNS